jgi:hypothetical protein
VDGSEYLQYLEKIHAAFMRKDMRCWRPSAARGTESLGFPLGSDLKSQIASIDLSGVNSPKARQVTVVTTNPTKSCERFREAMAGWSEFTQWVEVTSSSPWNSDDAMNAMLVPMDTLDAIVARVLEVP